MKILIISNNFFKAEGTIAKGIVKALPQCSVYFFSVTELKHRKEEFDELIRHIDIVHWLVNVAHLNEYNFNIFRDIKSPQVATVHHVCPSELIKIEKTSYANLIHVVSSEWKEYVQKHSEKPTVLASLGVDIDSFNSIEPKLFNKGEFRIGMMGFYPGKDNRKRFDIAIEVFKSLIAQKIEFKLILQGGGWEKYFKEFAINNINYEHCKIIDSKNVLGFFEKIHVYLCTSDYEGGPFPVLESLASGIPVVSTDIGISRDSLVLGGGILCDKGDVASLTDALVELKNNRIKYLRLSGEAKIVASNFDWVKLTESYYSLYKKTFKEWEFTNGKTFVFNKSSIDGDKQREIELSYDELHETIRLLYHGDISKGLKLGFILLFNSKVKLYRRWSLLKILISFGIGRKKVK